MCVDIDGERYEGCGPTKQRAKCNAAKAALKKAFQIFMILVFQISETKNLFMALHEHRPSLDTRCSTRTAKIIKKISTMCMAIDGERYEGCGSTKQRAKCNAAKSALN